IDRFNEIAKEWDSSPRRVQTATAVSKAILRMALPTGKERAMEFGCGTGLVTLALAPHLRQIVAVDSSPKMLAELQDKARRLNLGNVVTLKSDMPRTLPEGRFDLIFSSMTLHHIGDLQALFAALFDLLYPGGHIALADLDREDGSFHGDKPGIAHHGLDRGELEGWLATAGFQGPRFEDVHTVEKTNDDGSLRRYPMFLAYAERPA
ncbi:MAG: class I SAM-dependent DNA methyltransferase, partial [Minisyncoccia bacterium]